MQVFLRTSVGVIILAILVAVLQPYFQQKQFCYAGIKTSAERNSEDVNCFTVSVRGTFSNVFRSSKRKDVNQGYVIPGLWDGHGHLLQYGEYLSGVDLFGSKSLADVRERLGEYMKTHEDAGSAQKWIRGVGWDQAAWGGIMPTVVDLEGNELMAGKFIMVDRVDVHCVWVSRAVLELLPNPLPASPEGGEIVNDPGPGVFCDNAMEMVLMHWPSPDMAEKRSFVRRAMVELNSVGLVGMHDAGIRPRDVELYQDILRTHPEDWTVRVYGMRECDKRNTFCPNEGKQILDPDGKLIVRSVKLFADGALGSWGSALLKPYSDRPSTSGSLLVNASTLVNLAKSWAGEGFQVNIHAIGDHANRLAIDAQSAALASVCPGLTLKECQKQWRFRIEHAQIIDILDQKRIHEIGLIPSIQPTHATSDMSYAEIRLGHHRTAEEAYRMRSFLPLNPILGSDFPVEPPNPFHGIYAAVERRSPRTGLGVGPRNESWYPEESLTIEEALEGFTHGPAHGAFLEDRAGIIKIGAFADWVVLDKPLEETNAEDLRTLRVRETWVAGRRVYRRD